MPSWDNVLGEIGARQKAGRSSVDLVRRKYLKALHKHTGRNVIAYYSGWLTKPPTMPNLDVGDDDKNGFMTAVHRLERHRGLDLLLHTPGGSVAAAESLVDYLWQMFDKDIRVIVPQLAMSAGTMIACSARKIVMGKQSSLGPIDPQMGGLPAQAVLDEFNLALKQVQAFPAQAPIWQQMVARYHPSFLIECLQAIDWSKDMVACWLRENMFSGQEDAANRAANVVSYLGDHKTTANHSRHLSLAKCIELGLNIDRLEDDPKLQDLVLTVHHAFMHTFSMSPAVKIIENHMGVATVLQAVLQTPPGSTTATAPSQAPAPSTTSPQVVPIPQEQPAYEPESDNGQTAVAVPAPTSSQPGVGLLV